MTFPDTLPRWQWLPFRFYVFSFKSRWFELQRIPQLSAPAQPGFQRSRSDFGLWSLCLLNWYDYDWHWLLEWRLAAAAANGSGGGGNLQPDFMSGWSNSLGFMMPGKILIPVHKLHILSVFPFDYILCATLIPSASLCFAFGVVRSGSPVVSGVSVFIAFWCYFYDWFDRLLIFHAFILWLCLTAMLFSILIVSSVYLA